MKRIIAFILSMIIGILSPVNAKCASLSEEDENVKCKSAILMCIETGDILYEKNAYEKLSPASITKILALLVIMEKIDSNIIHCDDIVTTSENAVSMGGSQIWLEKDEQMTVEELLKAVIIASANDAITALGEFSSGSVTSFVKEMNDKAKELNLEYTNFENCTGLDDTVTNHYSCAHDLAVISRELIKYDLIKKYSTVWLESLRNGKTELNNTNKLVNSYNGITGLKTGTTSNAGFCLSATATRENMSLVAVVLGAGTSKDRFNSASYLLDWGFANYQLVQPQIDESLIKTVKINNGKIKEIVPVPKDNNLVLIEKGNDNFEYIYTVSEEMNAPIKSDDELGYISIKSNDKEIGKILLISGKDVEKITLLEIFTTILRKI